MLQTDEAVAYARASQLNTTFGCSMMRTATWVTAILVDASGVLLGFAYLVGGLEHTALFFWGAVVIFIFGALLGLLLAPRHAARIVNSSRIVPVVAALCIAVPAVSLLGSLDLGIISGQEWFAILVAALIGALNWAAFKLRVFALFAEQPNSTIERDARKSGARPSL